MIEENFNTGTVNDWNWFFKDHRDIGTWITDDYNAIIVSEKLKCKEKVYDTIK